VLDVGCGTGALVAAIVRRLAPVDAALAHLIVLFMTDPVRGLAEMARVMRSGGVAVASVWDDGQSRGPLGPFWTAALELDARMGVAAWDGGAADRPRRL